MLGGLILLAALGCALIGGVFFAFSTFVMGALARLPAVQGIAAMQAINVVVINPVFLGAFLGTGALCAVLIVAALANATGPGAGWLVAGGMIYLVGAVLVTMRFNVPRNNALAALDPNSPEAAALWADYVKAWTTWNHVRTAAGLAAAACLMIAMR